MKLLPYDPRPKPGASFALALAAFAKGKGIAARSAGKIKNLRTSCTDGEMMDVQAIKKPRKTVKLYGQQMGVQVSPSYLRRNIAGK